MSILEFEGRKRDHIEFALLPEHQASGQSGLERIHLEHDALPELNWDEISLETSFLGRTLKTPFVITGMTAGHSNAQELNLRFAQACARRGWIFGVGSQRREIEFLNSSGVDSWASIRENSSGLFLISNIGISQFIETPRQVLEDLVTGTGAQALAVHLNPLQEAIQIEGTPKFKGAREALSAWCNESEIPLILKETGCGFSISTLKKIHGIKLAALDVSGLGGTHWGRIEGARAAREKLSAQHLTAEAFKNWGESTVESLFHAKALLPMTPIWASGGVRNGLDAAKLLALGATHVGFAQPALEVALSSAQKLDQWMELMEFQLKTALFCTGSKTPQALQKKDGVWTQKNFS